MLISKVLQYIFPDPYDNPGFFPLYKFGGLDYMTVIQDILLPEILLLLVQEDLNCSRDKALEQIKLSNPYGVQESPGTEASNFSDPLVKAHNLHWDKYYGQPEDYLRWMKLENSMTIAEWLLHIDASHVKIEDLDVNILTFPKESEPGGSLNNPITLISD
jgi:hypothetical protein